MPLDGAGFGVFPRLDVHPREFRTPLNYYLARSFAEVVTTEFTPNAGLCTAHRGSPIGGRFLRYLLTSLAASREFSHASGKVRAHHGKQPGYRSWRCASVRSEWGEGGRHERKASRELPRGATASERLRTHTLHPSGSAGGWRPRAIGGRSVGGVWRNQR